MPARRRSSVAFPPWTPNMLELFDMAGRDWTPPKHVRSTLNADRTRLTVEARFRTADGRPVRLKAVCRKQANGVWMQTEEEMRTGFELKQKLEVVK